MWIRRAHDSTSSKASCSLPGAEPSSPCDGWGRVRAGDAARLPRITGICGKGGKTSFTKVKLCRTGKLNRTICRIGIFFLPFFEIKTWVCVWDIWLSEATALGFLLFFSLVGWCHVLTCFNDLKGITICCNVQPYNKPYQAPYGVSVTGTRTWCFFALFFPPFF